MGRAIVGSLGAALAAAAAPLRLWPGRRRDARVRSVHVRIKVIFFVFPGKLSVATLSGVDNTISHFAVMVGMEGTERYWPIIHLIHIGQYAVDIVKSDFSGTKAAAL